MTGESLPDEEHYMIITVIQCHNFDIARQQILQIQPITDGIELRIDYSNTLDLTAISALRHEFSLPMVFTLRKQSQGGLYQRDEAQRLQDILALCQINPDYIDIEYDVPLDFVETLKVQYPHIKIICSYHNFNETPIDLETIFRSMQHACFYAYKLAMKTNNTLDALRLMKFVNANRTRYFLTGIGMGEGGQCTRILSPVIGNAMHYVCINESQASAPGQLTLNELLTTYSFRSLNCESKIYALLGDPVSLSIGHILHNKSLALTHTNGVYVKLRVTQDELPDVIRQCRTLPFAGFSITMPLKETIIPLLDEICQSSQPIKAINSVVLQDEKLIGFNTDGSGAIKAITKNIDIAGQTVVILGAGGAARAIAYEAIQHSANVIILNRTALRAANLAEEFGCRYGELSSLSDLKYQVLINTLPSHVYADQSVTKWFHPDSFPPNCIAMDIVYNPIHTPFLQLAKRANCTCIFGYEMFINQAILQLIRWYNPNTQQLHDIKHAADKIIHALDTML
jgi:3-dehydroquinate dehydratase/shikimate dehydrogenase